MSNAQLRFPAAGLDLTRAFSDQRPRQVTQGVYARTCADAQNVRTFDLSQDRKRGGRRPGQVKFINDAAVSGWVTQDLNFFLSAGADVDLSQSGRVPYLVTVQQGDVYYRVSPDDEWTAATNNTGDTPPLQFDGIMFSASNQQKLWFADAVNWVYFDPDDQTVNRWSATAGLLPVDSENNTPRLIETWRGRTLLAGLLLDPQTIFASAVDDPTNFDYADPDVPVTMAWALTLGEQGLVGDSVFGMVPWTDDFLLMGGSHSLALLQGDPADGGKRYSISDETGMCWGRAWCRTPDGAVWFCANTGQVYRMERGGFPQMASQSIRKRLNTIDTGANSVRMAYNPQDETVNLFVTLLAEPSETTHYTMELRSGAWWPTKFANTNHNPLAMCVVDGNEQGERVLVLGGWDGYVRKFDPDAETDDGTAINAFVICGPVNSPNFDEMRVDELLADLGEDSGDITFSVYVGRTAEAALASEPIIADRPLSASRNYAQHIRKAGHACYIKFAGGSKWSLERLRLKFTPTGDVRARGKRSA